MNWKTITPSFYAIITYCLKNWKTITLSFFSIILKILGIVVISITILCFYIPLIPIGVTSTAQVSYTHFFNNIGTLVNQAIYTPFKATWTNVYYIPGPISTKEGTLHRDPVLLTGLRPWDTRVLNHDIAFNHTYVYAGSELIKTRTEPFESMIMYGRYDITFDVDGNTSTNFYPLFRSTNDGLYWGNEKFADNDTGKDYIPTEQALQLYSKHYTEYLNQLMSGGSSK